MFNEQTFDVILDRMKSRIPSEYDTRQSSFLHNATAPVAVELESMYASLDRVLDFTFFDTTTREGKLQRAKERGIDLTQFDATSAKVIIKVEPNTVNVPIGNRFNRDEVNYIVTDQIEAGRYHANCDTAGTVGNVTGTVQPVEFVDGLSTAEITEIVVYGEDEATEDEISKVYYQSIESQAFGGNRADYLEKTHKIAGVGGVKVYSASEWMGGGTVRLAITTSAYTSPSAEFISEVQEMIDPIAHTGDGWGLAPIGHQVTVTGVTDDNINIDMTLQLESGYVISDVLDSINNAVDKYFGELNAEWENTDNIIVRISQIESRVLGLAGIIDISDTAINGATTNYTLDRDKIAVRGTINAHT